jgi:hypothetical protein
MSSRLPLHGPRSHVRPPPEMLEPFVERTPHHWYWLQEFYDDGLDRTAIFLWAPDGGTPTRYTVTRLLWCWENSTTPERRLALTNTCGLLTCINPAHWHRIVAPNDVLDGAYRLPDTADAHLAHRITREARQLLNAKRVHIVRNDSQHAVCGLASQHLHSIARVDSHHHPITCHVCIRTWCATGGVLDDTRKV